jgi:hypothetical protein
MLVAAAGNSDVKNAELLRIRELYQNLAVAARICAKRNEAGTFSTCGRVVAVMEKTAMLVFLKPDRRRGKQTRI